MYKQTNEKGEAIKVTAVLLSFGDRITPSLVFKFKRMDRSPIWPKVEYYETLFSQN